MSQTYPCLNPVCPHNFTAAEVRSVGALKCPECGSEFQLRAGTAPAAEPAPAEKPKQPRLSSGKQPKPAVPKEAARTMPVARPVNPAVTAKALNPLPSIAVPSAAPPPAVALPVAAPPIAPPYMAPHAVPSAGTGPMLGGMVAEKLRERTEKKPWDWHRTAMIAGGVAVGISLLLGFYAILSNIETEDSGFAPRSYVGRIYNVQKRQEDIFRLTLPEGVWSFDARIRAGLNNAVVGMTRTEPDLWCAVAGKDYDKRQPRKAELLRECVARLDHYFGDTLELAEKAENTVFAGKDGQRLEFRGELKQVTWHGECYMFSDHGIGYFFFIAGPRLDVARAELAQFGSRELSFEVINKRHGWSPQPPRYINARGRNAPVVFRVEQDVFEQQNAADEDQNGEVLLLARHEDDNDPNKNRKNANILVLALDKADDLNQAVTSAITYLQERKKLEDADYKVEKLEETRQAEFGKPADVGNRRGRIIELTINLGNEPKRYNLLAVVRTDDKVYAIRCDATWEARQIWREEFIELLQQFTLKEK